METADPNQPVVENGYRAACSYHLLFDPIHEIDACFNGVLLEDALAFERPTERLCLGLEGQFVVDRLHAATLRHARVQPLSRVGEIGVQPPTALGRPETGRQ